MMLRIFALLKLFVLLNGAYAAELPPEVLLIRAGKVITAKPPQTVIDKACALVESASVGLEATNEWDQITASDSFLQLTFPKPRKLTLMLKKGLGARQREDAFVNAILIPLPENNWPPRLLARIGTNTHAFAKYSPIALKHLSQEPLLNLAKTKPYSSLADLPE